MLVAPIQLDMGHMADFEVGRLAQFAHSLYLFARYPLTNRRPGPELCSVAKCNVAAGHFMTRESVE
jgi:hypothetical protein